MSTPNASAGAISFAHLAGITAPIHAAKADVEEDKKDAKKADDDSDDESMESDEPAKDDDKKEDAKAESDEPDKDDEKAESDDEKPGDKAKKAVARERARWATVLGHKSFARAPGVAAKMLATTSLSASAILGVLEDVPASGSSSDARSARNPNLGAAAPASAPTTDARWGAAFKRAGIA